MPSLVEPYAAFFAPEHHAFESEAAAFASRDGARGDIHARVRALGRAGLLDAVGRGDVRTLAVRRGQLAYADAMDDLAFIVQELGGFPLERAGAEPELLARVRAGDAVVVFGMTEPGAGSDVAAMSTLAERDGHGYRVTGLKHFISNAPEADHAVVFAKLDGKIAAFLVDAPATEAQAVSGHSIGRLVLDAAPARLLAARGGALALGTLERCRPTVGLAAWGLARHGFDETVGHLKSRVQFGRPLAEQPVVQSRVADMALDLEQAALAALWACWTRDVTPADQRTGYMSAVGKLTATEACGRVLDQCVQLQGGLGVEESSLVQRLWREARPLRIYEGATDVLKTVIAERWLG